MSPSDRKKLFAKINEPKPRTFMQNYGQPPLTESEERIEKIIEAAVKEIPPEGKLSSVELPKKPKVKKTAGRPRTSLKWQTAPISENELEVFGASGLTFDVIAAHFGLTTAGFASRLRKEPHLKAAFDKGIENVCLDLYWVEFYGARGTSEKDLATLFGLTKDQLKRVFERDPQAKMAYERGRANLRFMVASEQLRILQGNNPGALTIWLGKAILGQQEALTADQAPPAKVEYAWTKKKAVESKPKPAPVADVAKGNE